MAAAPAKAVPPKPTVSGLKPASPDQKALPASAVQPRKWDAAPAAPPLGDADRSRRLAQSDPQGRYGNSEVARVAVRQNPAPLGARAAPAGKLPEAGPKAMGGKHKGGGHGAKSASPGAAKAAVEAKHRGDKKEPTKAAPKPEDAKGKPPAKGGAGDGAKADHKTSKEKVDSAESGGEAASASPAAAAGGGDVAALIPPPPQRPRLEGTEATVLSMPVLADQQRERVRAQTGLTLNEHYSRAQVHLDRLSARATSEQLAIVLHIELIEAEVRRDLDNAAALIGPSIDAGIERVRGACADARADIKSASEGALAIVEKHANDADQKVDAAALTSKEAVDKAVKAASPAVRALHEETMKPIREMLIKQGQAFADAAGAQGTELKKKADEMAPDVKLVSGDAITRAIAEKRHTVAVDNMKEAQEGFAAAGEKARQDILAQESSLSLSFLMFVNPVAVKVEHIGGADGKTVVEKGGEVRLRLATDYERSKGFVEETTKRALKALDALEQQGVKHMHQLRKSLEAMAASRRDQLCSSILSGQAPAADAWAQQMKAVNELVADQEIVDIRRLEPRFVEALDSMNALSARQRLDFDAQARSGFDEARAGMDADLRSIDESADSFVDSARDTRRQAVTLRDYGKSLSNGFHAVANVAGVNAQEFRLQSEEKLGLAVTDTRKQMTELCKTTDDAMTKSVTKFGEALGEQGKKVAINVSVMVAGVDAAVWSDLADRAARAYKAMDRIGTDETGLFEALYAMTPLYGEALCEFWVKADHVHDLWWWLDDELSGDEYWTAYYYLKGDPVQGAYFQMKASIHWYGDDVTQIESGLRALNKDQLKELDSKYPEARQKLESNLKGTNLQVAQALLAGRTARADALRLREAIDAARAAGNDDKLHDALSKIDPKRLPEVRTEFVDILAGHAMQKEAPVSPKEGPELDKEKADFASYITRPVTVLRPPAGPHSRAHYETLTLSDSSKTLAKALATSGEGSPEARAARLAYEAKRGGKPRPEKLALALDDPELIAARNNKILKQPDAKAEDVKDAQDNLARLEARRSEMMKQFATFMNADKKIAEDPQKAKEYTKNAVADLFGDDDLGREFGSSMVEKGKANPAVAIKYAVRGWGTNEELIRKTLKGMTADEIKQMKEEYSDRFDKGNPNKLYQDLGVFQNEDTAKVAGLEGGTGGDFFTELSGDERQEVEELLLGKPENDRDRMRLARLKYQHQKGEGSTWATGLLVSAVEPNDAIIAQLPEKDRPPGNFASKSLDMNKSLMDEMVKDAGGEEKAFDKDGNFKGVPGKHSVNDFRLRVAATSEMAENYKHHIDSICDMITGAIAIIGAIVGTIVVTVLTLGTATPLVVAAWAAGIAAVTGGAVMATKYALKGSRYGWEEAAVDGAMTLVDAATAGLMAGAGAKAARAATQLAALKAAARVPAQEAIAAGLIKEHARKEVVRGFARTAGSAFVSGTARTAMTDGVWDEGVLTGLGRSVKGGAHAAAVGLATHGASHAFTQSGLGQKLGQSTSYFKRGLGTGLGGALGGMAGSGAELTLDALGGHAQGSWYDALGSIALAGGRGFAENFGHGIAEVPKARRDAAQEHFNEMRKMSDNERVARFGMTEADAVGDQRFARMAAAAALKNDPKTNVKAFLADLNASVAQDRAVVETNRQLVRQFRREALASIPEDRRGEFADVPIHVLPDAQFEKFTGSQSGRAVTIFVDGEAQILVRKSATPETLREEGIHVLQSRDPKWREKIARLDEKTMSRWNELDLETQLSLYRDKIEVEVDAHQRLRRDLLDEADRTSDPVRKQKLLAQAEEAEGTLTQLQKRSAEVNAIGPEQVAAIKRGGPNARPQYLREPARLFAKKAVLPASALGASELLPELTTVRRKTPLAHGDDLSGQQRYDVEIENSTWSNDFPKHKIRQVGGAWPEMEFDPTPGATGKRERWYRMVELVDAEGTVVDRRREILQIEGNKRWQQRGSETSERGSLHEETSRQRTMARALEEIIAEREAAGTRSTLGDDFRPNQDSVVPIGVLHERGDRSRRPLSAQHSGGAGFDDVKIRFRKVGREVVAEIVIIEAKGYARSLTLEDFSAITANMEKNLSELGNAIAKSNLSKARREAVARAIAARNLSFELHLSPSSELGRMKAGGATIVRDIKNTEMARRHLAALETSFEAVDRNSLGTAQRQQLDNDVARITSLRKQLADAYASEPFSPAKIQKALSDILDGKAVDSAIGIAKRNRVGLDQSAVDIQRQKIDSKGVDAKYARRAAAVRAKASGRAESAMSIAQSAAAPDKNFRPAPTARTAPADVSLARSTDGSRTLAVTRPSVGSPGNDSDGVGAASRQLVALLRDGIPVPGGRSVHPDSLFWDAAAASPAQIEQVLKKVRDGLAANNGNPSRLRVLVEGTVADDPAAVLATLKLSGEVDVTPVIRTPDGTRTWVLSFSPQWLDSQTKGGRK